MAWQKVTPARRAYAIATLGWVVIFIARFIVQNNLYNSSDTTTLGIVRILMGWPLTGVVTVLTIWMVRRANKAVEAAVERGEITLTPKVSSVGPAKDAQVDGDQADNDQFDDASNIDTTQTANKEDKR